ncbi:MAG: redoxin domain-containing protein [Nannocystis sp.]|uniref:redoxin family protein n=1 Tax=Nannocystis sp. TaxID=1962667 RepID=UPI002422A1AF|nr:redoxin family protein [Nannocystis sp.]MBK9754891.1 redoxin domain-containing protein [Nannocystis sp.]
MHRPLLPLVILSLALACDSGPKPPEAAKAAPASAPATPATTPAATPVAPIANPLAEPGAVAAIGQPAPDFTLEAADGSKVKLSDFKGKRVVLEWFNPECPFVKQAHGDGALKDLAARTTATGVVWLAINSGAPGKQGHGAELNKQAAATWKLGHPILLDAGGYVGKAYDATNTPHLYVIDEKGVLVYRGALDNAPMGEPDGGTRIAYLEDTLAALTAGKPVATPETKAWGCSVKYDKPAAH